MPIAQRNPRLQGLLVTGPLRRDAKGGDNTFKARSVSTVWLVLGNQYSTARAKEKTRSKIGTKTSNRNTKSAERGLRSFARMGLDFEEAVALRNAADKPLENVSLADDPSQQTSTICTQQHAVDYDGDGDLDLVVGCFGPKFFLYENKANEENGEASLSENPVELPIESPNFHSAPHLVDWDADGDLDLLSGSGEGGVIFSENTGSGEKPVWSSFKQLVDFSSDYQQSTDGDSELSISKSTRTWAVDFNGDGLLDLLVGDSANIINAADGVSVEECKKLRAENDKEMAALTVKYEPVMKEYYELLNDEKEASDELEEKMGKYREGQMAVYNARSKFEESTRTGFVWLLIQKPKTKQVSVQESGSQKP